LLEALRRKDGSDGLSRRKLTDHTTYAVRDVRNSAHWEGCPGHNKALVLSDALFPARSRLPGQKRAGATRADLVPSELRKSPTGTADSRNLVESSDLQNMSRGSRGVPCRSRGACQRYEFCQVSSYLAPCRTCEDRRALTPRGHVAAPLTGRLSTHVHRLRDLRDASMGLAHLS
jgi:hypothetical protein